MTHVYHPEKATSRKGAGKVGLTAHSVQCNSRISGFQERCYLCGYCGKAKIARSASTDGQVRIRCECGGTRQDGVKRMHAHWVFMEVDDEKIASATYVANSTTKKESKANDSGIQRPAKRAKKIKKSAAQGALDAVQEQHAAMLAGLEAMAQEAQIQQQNMIMSATAEATGMTTQELDNLDVSYLKEMDGGMDNSFGMGGNMRGGHSADHRYRYDGYPTESSFVQGTVVQTGGPSPLMSPHATLCAQNPWPGSPGPHMQARSYNSNANSNASSLHVTSIDQTDASSAASELNKFFGKDS